MTEVQKLRTTTLNQNRKSIKGKNMSEKGILEFTYSVVCGECSNKEEGTSSSKRVAERVLLFKGWLDIVGTGWVCPECGKHHLRPQLLV